jgi:hypothetical protein
VPGSQPRAQYPSFLSTTLNSGNPSL